MSRLTKTVTFNDTNYRIKQFGYLEGMRQMKAIVTPLMPVLISTSQTMLAEGEVPPIAGIVADIFKNNVMEIIEQIPEYFSGISLADRDDAIDWEDHLAGDFGLLIFLLCEVTEHNYSSLFTMQDAIAKSSLSKKLNALLKED